MRVLQVATCTRETKRQGKGCGVSTLETTGGMEIDDMSPLISRRFEASLNGNREEPNNMGPMGAVGSAS